MSRPNRLTRSLLTGVAMAAILVGAWSWIHNQEEADGIPWILRANHRLQEKIWSALSSPERSAPRPRVEAGRVARINGDIGLEDAIEEKTWRLRVYAEDKLVHTLPLESIRALNRTSTSSEFYCIEGWSMPISYAGVRFSEFLKTYALDTGFRYVGLETPDRKYYVSIDMESMLHEQTLLAYEMNERTLSAGHGFPLRLIIPVKYGIKSLKRIGTIRLSNTRLPDYWAEQGYDWYSGL